MTLADLGWERKYIETPREYRGRYKLFYAFISIEMMVWISGNTKATPIFTDYSNI